MRHARERQAPGWGGAALHGLRGAPGSAPGSALRPRSWLCACARCVKVHQSPCFSVGKLLSRKDVTPKGLSLDGGACRAAGLSPEDGFPYGGHEHAAFDQLDVCPVTGLPTQLHLMTRNDLREACCSLEPGASQVRWPGGDVPAGWRGHVERRPPLPHASLWRVEWLRTAASLHGAWGVRF